MNATKPSYECFVDNALAAGLVLSVGDEEGFTLKRSADKAQIMEYIQSFDTCTVNVRDIGGTKQGWATVCPGLAPDETLADWSDNFVMNGLCDGV